MSNKSHVVTQMWGMAFKYCVFVCTFLFNIYVEWMCPNFKRTPILQFGSIIMAHVPTMLQTGLGVRSFTTIAIGSTPGVKGDILLYNTKTRHAVVGRTFKVIGPFLPAPSNVPCILTLNVLPYLLNLQRFIRIRTHPLL